MKKSKEENIGEFGGRKVKGRNDVNYIVISKNIFNVTKELRLSSQISINDKVSQILVSQQSESSNKDWISLMKKPCPHKEKT